MIEVNAIREKKQIEGMKRILKANNMRDYLLFVIGINVGLRVSDLLGLRISDVITINGKVKPEVTVHEGKTKKARTFTINKSASNGIKEYLSSLDNKYGMDWFLFRSRKGNNKPISRVQAWQVLSDGAKLIGITETIGTHTLRKTFGYWAYKQGIDITVLQDIFNHSTPKITLRYIGIAKEDRVNVYNNLNL
ncbi:site-specific integrase [Clostridium estertheticum]|uniref:site-specific integrase n=1 Tax=Clostridium estertheticum TaxID=238834 RepID=UPI001C0CCA54|nr:site-specific integrase [Clostridium estertheticum]MBU3215863.1 site-specific integrase [Clostridium estertheticum]WAG57819.1 site-specific integrase [Clostridium estertheticum]